MIKLNTRHLTFAPVNENCCKNIIALLFLSIISAAANNLYAQNSIADTGFNKIQNIEEVIVSTTRTTKSIGDIPVPIQVISKNLFSKRVHKSW